jgi:hypothetical protein
MNGKAEAAELVVRDRAQLAVDIAHYALMNRGVETIPADFFRSQEEIKLAESLTEEEILRAGACVLEALAEQPRTSPRVKTAAWTIADALHVRARGYANRARVPQQYTRGSSRMHRARRIHRRATAPTRGSPDEPPDEPPDVETWHGLQAASSRMVQRCERRRAKQAAAAA